MAKIIIESQKNFQLGGTFDSPQLKIGRNLLDEELYWNVRDQWFFKALVDNGSIIVKGEYKDPSSPAVPLKKEDIVSVVVSEVEISTEPLPETKEDEPKEFVLDPLVLPDAPVKENVEEEKPSKKKGFRVRR